MKKLTLIITLVSTGLFGCQQADTAPVASSGAQKVTVKVPKDANGMTVEQKNVADRLLLDNKPGSIKHLYVISAYSGQVLIYSTVKGKVTSSGKRLTNTQTLTHCDKGEWSGDCVMPAIQDDGTYGSSVPYLFWFDSKGIYHQHYVAGGQILHVSDQPISVKSVILNMEVDTK